MLSSCVCKLVQEHLLRISASCVSAAWAGVSVEGFCCNMGSAEGCHAPICVHVHGRTCSKSLVLHIQVYLPLHVFKQNGRYWCVGPCIGGNLMSALLQAPLLDT